MDLFAGNILNQSTYVVLKVLMKNMGAHTKIHNRTPLIDLFYSAQDCGWPYYGTPIPFEVWGNGV